MKNGQKSLDKKDKLIKLISHKSQQISSFLEPVLDGMFTSVKLQNANTDTINQKELKLLNLE